MIDVPQLATRRRDLEPVEVILDDLYENLGRYVVLGRDERVILPVWIVHTHAIEAAYQTPYLHVWSAMKRCGKTRLLEQLRMLCAHAVHAEHMSLASIHQILSHSPLPTILWDEMDTVFRGRGTNNQALRGVINAGNRRGATVIRVENKEVVEYQVFGPKVLCGIGNSVPDTIVDRSIPIRMNRKTRSEPIERFRYLEAAGDAARLYYRCNQWAEQMVPHLRESRPELPEALTDRQQDFAEPLLAIADAAGARWRGMFEQALVSALDAERAIADDEPLPLVCLRDCQTFWEAEDKKQEKTVTRARSSDIVSYLNHLSRWKERNGGITDRDLAWNLNAWDIHPKKLRFPEGTKQGYERSAFAEPWERYL